MKMVHLSKFCNLYGGEKCCRYLCTGSVGFTCAKKDETLKKLIDSKANNMVAKGDNCDGIDNEI